MPLVIRFIRHILNSSGIARMPQYQFEMVRPGIGIYGIRPSGRAISESLQEGSRQGFPRSRLSDAGEPVGYGCADVSDNDRSIAILPVGYADGLSRKLGNRNGKSFYQ